MPKPSKIKLALDPELKDTKITFAHDLKLTDQQNNILGDIKKIKKEKNGNLTVELEISKSAAKAISTRKGKG